MTAIAPFICLPAAPAEAAAAPPPGAPALYAYRVDYRTAGGLEKTRLGIVAGIDPFKVENPDVVPIAEAEPARTEAALAALRTAGVKTGVVVAGYEDAHFEVERILGRGPSVPPRVHARAHETHAVWPVSGGRAARELARFVALKACVPFDGLHHFKAARRFRDEMRGAAEQAFYPLALLVNVLDFGMSFGSYTYLAPPREGFDINRFVAACDESFTLQDYRWEDDAGRARAWREFHEDLRIRGTTAVAVGAAFAGTRQFLLFTLKENVPPASLLPPDTPTALHEFAVMHLRLGFVARRYFETEDAAQAWNRIAVFPTPDEALAALDARGGAAFFVSPPNKRALMALAQARRRLPPDSVRLNPGVPEGLFTEKIAGGGRGSA